MGSSSRLLRRLLIFVYIGFLAGANWAQVAPVETLVQDTLYRANGKVAHGTLTIRWNGFAASGGEAVAAGEMTVKTDANGGISIPLMANAGSSPAGTYYRVTLKLDDGTTSEEVWVVPAVATTTIAAVRAKIVPQAVAAQFVSEAGLDSALATVNATLAAVAPATLVHLNGAETIVGAKTFTVSPEVPTPTDAGSAVGKGYVDGGLAALATVASTGNYNDLLNKPAGANLAAPGAIGSQTPGTVNATGYSVSGTPLGSVHLSDSASLVKTSTANTFSQPQTVTFTGSDASVAALMVDASGSSMATNPVMKVALPSSGNQRAMQAINGGDSKAWYSLEYNAGGTGLPGISFGPGGSAARDTLLYRSGANGLSTSGSFSAASYYAGGAALGFSNLAGTPSLSQVTGGLGYTPLNPANNLSDVANPGQVLANLGLGTAAQQNSAAFDAAGAATTVQTNLASEVNRAEAVEAGKAPLVSPSFSGTVNTGAYAVNGTALASTHLSDTGILTRTTAANNFGANVQTADVSRNSARWFDLRSKGACSGSSIYAGDDTAALVAAMVSPAPALSNSKVEIPLICYVNPGASTGTAALLVPASQQYFKIEGNGGDYESTIQDRAVNPSSAPMLQIGDGLAGSGVGAGGDLQDFQLKGGAGVSYPKGQLVFQDWNLTSVTRVELKQSGPIASSSIGLTNVLTGSQTQQFFAEMRFRDFSSYCPTLPASNPTGITSTGILLRAPDANTDFDSSNIEGCSIAMEFLGSDGTPTLSWTGGHFERDPFTLVGGFSFLIDQAQPFIYGADVESGMIYLGSSVVGADIEVSATAAGVTSPYSDNGIGNRFRRVASSQYYSQAVELDGGEWYRVPGNIVTDPLFLVSGTSGWTTSSATVATTSLKAPGAKAGKSLLITSSTSGYAASPTYAVAPSTDYIVGGVFYLNQYSPTAEMQIWDQGNNLVWDSGPFSGAQATPSYNASWAYRVVRQLVNSGSATSWTVRILTPAGTSTPVIVSALMIVPSLTTMGSGVLTLNNVAGSPGCALGAVTSVAGFNPSGYPTADCAVPGRNSGAVNNNVSWTIPAQPYASFVRMTVKAAADAVNPVCVFGAGGVGSSVAQAVYFLPGTTYDYVFPLGNSPTTIQCQDFPGPSTDGSDMVISQVSVVPIYQQAVVPVTSYADGNFVQGITPDGTEQRAAVGFSTLASGTNTAAAMVLGSGSSLTVSGTGTNNATSVNGNSYPAAAGFASGGVPYFSSTTAESSSAALTKYGVLFGGGAGGAPTSSAQGAANMPLIGQGAANPIFSTIAYPTSLTSGGLLYASSTTGIASSGLVATNVLFKSGGAGAAPVASSITDNGSVLSTAAQGFLSQPASYAGSFAMHQGTVVGVTTNAIAHLAPTAVTGYTVTEPGVGPANNNMMKSYSAIASNNTTESFLQAPRKAMLSAAYTNATATASTILSFPVDASTSYVVRCHGTYKAAAGGALVLTLTGPASPTLVQYDFMPATALASGVPTFYDVNATGSVYPSAVGSGAVTTAASDMPWNLEIGYTNGTTAGTLAIQGQTISTNTLTVEAGSYCQMQ